MNHNVRGSNLSSPTTGQKVKGFYLWGRKIMTRIADPKLWNLSVGLLLKCNGLNFFLNCKSIEFAYKILISPTCHSYYFSRLCKIRVHSTYKPSWLKQIILLKKKKRQKKKKKLYNTKSRLCLIYVELTNKKFLFISFSFFIDVIFF